MPLDESISETTELLRAWAGGDELALKRLMPRVYRELRRLAGHMLKNQPPGQTMQASDLVHEAYIRLVDVNHVDWKDRAQFFSIAATLMRRILIDRARRRVAAKRGGKLGPVRLTSSIELVVDRSSELIAVDDALNALARIDPRKAKVVELRFFVGLTVKETAAVLDVSEETVMRDWNVAHAWLLREISRG
jgi:RNA polymerase sigma factor (TIGR02999 family)